MKDVRYPGNPGVPWGFVPLGLLVVVVGAVPGITALADSFFRIVGGNRTYAGLSNYRLLFSDPAFAYSAALTLAWALASSALSVLIGFPLATLLHESRGVFRLAYAALLVPWAVPSFISIPVWRMLFHGAGGDSILSFLFGLRVNLLTDPLPSFVAALFVNGWMNAPVSVFVVYGALRACPKSVGEAASLDGAGGFRLSMSVHLPQAKGSLAVVATLAFLNAVKEFNLPYLFTAGGPPFPGGITRRTIVGATTTLEVYLYELFRDSENLGLAAAHASILALVTGVAATVAFSVRAGRERWRRNPDPESRRRDALRFSSIPDSKFMDAGWAVIRAVLALITAVSSLLVAYAVLRTAFSRLSINYVDSVLPSHPTPENFIRIFTEDGMGRIFINTLCVSLPTGFLMPFLVFPAALFLRKRGRRTRAGIFGIVQAASAAGGMHSLIPLYAVALTAGLIDSYFPIVVIYLFHAAPFSLFTTAACVERIPRGLEEAAHMEGAGPVRRFFRILLPLSLPAAVTSAMVAFLAAWNGFLVPLLFLNDDAGYTVGVRIASYVGGIASGSPQWNRFAAASSVNLVIVVLLLVRLGKPLGDSSVADYTE